MWFKWKKLYILAEERIERQREYIRGIKGDKKSYDTIIDNLNFIVNKYKYDNINIYFENDSLYYIVETWLPGMVEDDYVVSLYTYKLHEIPINISPVAELSARLELNIANGQRVAYIESIDTIRELQKGHGSRLLKRLIYIAEHRDINVISGKLDRNTPIGLENLKKFYIKNRFEVNGNGFKMILKEPKTDML